MTMIPKYTDDELDQILLRQMQQHQGRQNAIERWTLVREIFGAGADLPRNDDNLQDRMIRAGVQRLRGHRHFILDMNDGHGRFIAITEDEYRDFRTSYLKPLRARADVIRSMDRHAVKQWPNLLQPALFDLDALTNVEMGR